MSDEVERTRRAYEDFARTAEPHLDGLHPDVEWHTAEDLPDSGVHRGHAAVAALLRGWAESFEQFRADVEDIGQQGDCVIASVMLRGQVRGSGEEVQLPEIHVWRFRDGLVIEVREYRTLEQALDAVGPAKP